MRRRAPDEVDLALWSIVTSTVRPLRPAPTHVPAPIVAAPVPPSPPARQGRKRQVPPPADPTPASPPAPRPAHRPGPRPPDPIEPGRRRRLDRARDRPAATIDLHGLNQDRAREALTRFILGAVAEHDRTVLVITGKGALGDGVLRRRVPEWLADPPLRSVVAGLSQAHRRHGGEGALYVALKRPTV